MRIRVCALNEIEDGQVKVFEEGEVTGIVVRSGDTFYGCERYCSHELFPLEFGMMTDDHVLRCTFHGSDFDLRTGEVLGPPADVGIKVYPVEVVGDEVFVDVPTDD